MDLIWSVMLVLFAIVTVFMYIIARKKIYVKWGFGIAFGIVFIFNAILYAKAYWPSSSGMGLHEKMSAVFRGLHAAACVFSGEHMDVLDEAGMTQKRPLMDTLAWASHLLAIIIVSHALMAIFGRKVTDYFRILAHKILPLCDKKWMRYLPILGRILYVEYHYIIIGCGKPMKVFLDDLLKDKTYRKRITVITGEVDDKNPIYEKLVDDDIAVKRVKADEKALRCVGAYNLHRNTRVIAIDDNDECNLEVADIIVKEIESKIYSLSDDFLDKHKHFDTLENIYKKIVVDDESKKRVKSKFDIIIDDNDRRRKSIRKCFVGILSSKDNDEEFNKKIKGYIKDGKEEKGVFPDDWEFIEQLRKELKEYKKASIKLEMRVMYSFVERAEHFAFADKSEGRVRFFNPHELRARAFFSDHPITSFIPEFIDNDKARLRGKFNHNEKIIKPNGKEYCIKSIFVGFGPSNYYMLKESVMTGQLLGCDYNAIVFDDKSLGKMSHVRWQTFENQSNGLFLGGCERMVDENGEKYEYLDGPKEKYNIEYRDRNILTKKFYDDVVEEIVNSDFSAVYVSLGDDKLGVETACEIRRCLYERTRESCGKRVKIFVKIHNKDSVYAKDEVINNKERVKESDTIDALRIERFGADKDVLTARHIINESLDTDVVQKIANREHGLLWEELSETQRDSNRQQVASIRVKLNLLGFDLTCTDNNNSGVESCIGVDVYYERYMNHTSNDEIKEIIKLSIDLNNRTNKEIALRTEKDNSDIEEVENARKKYFLDYLDTENDGEICDTPRNNLARLEHLRWNTFHLVNGWAKMPKKFIKAGNSGRKDKYARQHACITTFKGLVELRELQAKGNTLWKEDKDGARRKEDTIRYDYHMMDVLPGRLSGCCKWRIVKL